MVRVEKALGWPIVAVLAALGVVTACEGSQGVKGATGAAGEACSVKDNGDGTKTITCGTTSVTLGDGKAGTNGKDGAAGAAGTDGKNGTNGTNGTDGAAGTPGAAGKDGTSCTSKDNGDGTKTITCTDGTSISLADGPTGTTGATGATGNNGQDGAAGKDGTACSVKANGDGTKTVSCTDGTAVNLADGATGAAGKDGAAAKPCTVKDNGNGTKTISCPDGTTVSVANGLNGANGLGVQIPNFHGIGYLQSTGQYANSVKTKALATITAASADVAGKVTVDFKVTDVTGKIPVTWVTAINANFVKLQPPSGGESFTKWVPYMYNKVTTANQAKYGWPAPDGTVTFQPAREKSNADPTKGGTLTNNGDGSYHYVFWHNFANLTKTADGLADLADGATKYDRTLTHRVLVTFGGSSGPTADAYLDFVPDGVTPLTTTRNIVETATCQQCHGPEFHGHGGDRLNVTTCQTCHNPSNTDPYSGNVLDLKVWIHKLHMGSDLPSNKGKDGIFWDDTTTANVNEAADNGAYRKWNSDGTFSDWSDVDFPALAQNCTKCHQGKGAQVDNWKNVPSRAACGSCHDDVDFVAGTNHVGGVQADDSACKTCHPATGNKTALIFPIDTVHTHFETDDIRIPMDYNPILTVSTPKNGKYFDVGESPVVTLVLQDPENNNAPIDHTTLAQDATPEGCDPTKVACPAKDGLFTTANFFAHGPRAKQVPVLTTSARAWIASATAGTFDLTLVKAAVTINVDQGQVVWTKDAWGGDVQVPGIVTVPFPAAAGSFADVTKVTVDELVTYFNKQAAFAKRAIAFKDPATGKFGVRSRNLGTVFAIQFPALATGLPDVFNTTVFATFSVSAGVIKSVAGDTSIHTLNVLNTNGTYSTMSTVSNSMINAYLPVASNGNLRYVDPKVTYAKDKITYTLDPVDDLVPGTYFVNIEFKDRGSISGQAQNYKGPTVAKTGFQVKQATEEAPVAGNCNSCHESPTGIGQIFDVSGHHKILDHTAPDQCGACHDQQVQGATGDWSGAKAISRRIHGVHNGANLTYPLTTVGAKDEFPARHWDIRYPQDIRNCEQCHVAGESSGSWMTKPSRNPCYGCHDDLAAQAHFKQMTFDPTPADPYSGDEIESCNTCHAAK